MYVFNICACVSESTFICAYVFLDCSLPYSLSQGLSIKPRAHCLAEQTALEILLSLWFPLS